MKIYGNFYILCGEIIYNILLMNYRNIVKSLTFFVVAIKFTREFKGVDLIR